MEGWQDKRHEAFDRYMAGESPKAICDELGVSRSWLFKWIQRSKESGGSDFASLSRAPKNPRRTTCPFLYGCTLRVRRELEESQYLSVGAPYIVWELEKMGCTSRLSISTVERHLRTAKVTLKKQPRRKKVPEKLKATATCHNDCQQADVVGPRYIKEFGAVYSLNLIDVFARVAAIRPCLGKNSETLSKLFLSIWEKVGVPKMLWLDNELSFRGSNRYPRSFSKLIRFCLFLGTEVIFIPIAEPWWNCYIESFNSTFDRHFWQRQRFLDFSHLSECAKGFEASFNGDKPQRVLGYKTPLEFAQGQKQRLLSRKDLPDICGIYNGKISLIRRIDPMGSIDVFGEKFHVDVSLATEYVKATIDTEKQLLGIVYDDEVVKEHIYQLNEPVLSKE